MVLLLALESKHLRKELIFALFITFLFANLPSLFFKQITMSSFKLRPRFKDQLDLTPEEFQDLFDKALKNNEDFVGLVSPSYVVLKIPPQERHFWSPQLTITCEKGEEPGTTLRGLYGPKPSVWAIFFMSYAALGVLGLFTGVYGFSQWILDKPAPILWFIPVLAGIALVLYFVAQTGQKVGAEQMFRLHHFYEATLQHTTSLK